MVLGWLIFKPRPVFDLRSAGYASLWPLVWAAYTLVHGALSGWYPYPFLAADRLGYAHVALNLLGVLALLGVVACVFTLAGRAQVTSGPAAAEPGCEPLSLRLVRGSPLVTTVTILPI
jgi:hypothetical protein